mmetsp:Transcript_29603/g.96419  ORF Transcript_29603/g.96419 Transcript_29603/m.96419 type:complete len:556 (-) Transcript_29603:246-1913(-)
MHVSTQISAVKPVRVARRSSREASRGRRRVAPARASSEDESGASKDVQGAGATFVSPGWLTALQRNWGDQADVPRCDAKPEDVQDLLGGALFLALYKWMNETGPVYLLPTGPISSFVVISEPQAAKHVLKNYTLYQKGLVSEISQFLFGDGFAVAEGDLWMGRRRAVAPSLHKTYLNAMVTRVFSPCAEHLAEKLAAPAAAGTAVDIEARMSQVTLDVIGKAVFNYDFEALNTESPIIQAVYTALKETEQRATDLLPIWKVPGLRLLSPRQRKAEAAVRTIQECTEMLITKCKRMVEEEGERITSDEEYLNEADPSILRFLLAARTEVSEKQLRDDLLSMLVAGHETTGSVLTWTLYLLAQNADKMAEAQREIDRVLGPERAPAFDDYAELKYLTRCVNESMRLYPHPPVLIRRAQQADTLPGDYEIPQGQDIIISVYNIHHSKAVWGDDVEEFRPERWDLDGPIPNETNTDFKYIPFSGGARKCVGDQFAMVEAVTILAVLLRKYTFTLVPGQQINMTTGATIHTTEGMYVTMEERTAAAAQTPSTPVAATTDA